MGGASPCSEAIHGGAVGATTKVISASTQAVNSPYISAVNASPRPLDHSQKANTMGTKKWER